MKRASTKILILFASMGLTSCFTEITDTDLYTMDPPPHQQASNDEQNNASLKTTQLASNETYDEPMSGHSGRTMDVNDRSKMAHALDSPLGKSTQWVNANTGTTYTVVPKRKISVNGNPYCREYTTTITSGNRSRERTGTACVDANGKWQAVR